MGDVGALASGSPGRRPGLEVAAHVAGGQALDRKHPMASWAKSWQTPFGSLDDLVEPGRDRRRPGSVAEAGVDPRAQVGGGFEDGSAGSEMTAPRTRSTRRRDAHERRFEGELAGVELVVGDGRPQPVPNLLPGRSGGQRQGRAPPRRPDWWT